MLKKIIKAATMHRGIEETAHIRAQIDAGRRTGWPYCPVDEGDLLYLLARSVHGQDALEIGFATGSTAAYMLAGLEASRLISIDYAQDQYERAGEKLIQRMGYADRHELIEANSVLALPEMYREGKRFGLSFLDGWKSFDHMWVDTYFCARMLNRRGYMVFDDARMPSVRKCISLLTRYYAFKVVDAYEYVGALRQRMWHLLSTRSMRPPYVALQKTIDIDQTEAGRRFDFWRTF